MTLVVRTIVPIVAQDNIFPGAGSQFGLGDSLQSFFFVPPTVGGFTWGAGPALQYRTGTDPLLTTGKWGADRRWLPFSRQVLGPLAFSPIIFGQLLVMRVVVK